MSATIARSVNKIPSLVRFLILFLVFIALIHLFSLDIIQNINTNTDKSEVKASLKHPNANMEEKTSHRQGNTIMNGILSKFRFLRSSVMVY